MGRESDQFRGVLTWIASAFALLGITFVGARCGGTNDGLRKSAGAPGIVLVIIDTLRLDATGKAPDGHERMPAFAAFARQATSFSDASSGSSWTAPSVATILTGLEPRNTGVQGRMKAESLPLVVTTLAEALQSRKFSTAAYTAGGWLTAERGYAQGFDTFDVGFDANGPEKSIEDWQAKRAKNAPFFLLLHTCAAHDPYGRKDHDWREGESIPEVAAEAKELIERTKAAGWKFSSRDAVWVLERFLLDARARASMGFAMGHPEMIVTLDRILGWVDGPGRGTPELLALVPKAREGYLRGLEYADLVLKQTLASLDACHLPEGTVIMVVGDHGEGLGEHGMLLHGRWLYEELVRVPFVIRAPGRLPAGAAISGSCGLVDAMPTLLELADVKPPIGLDGRSLLKLARGEERGHPVFAAEDRQVESDGQLRAVRISSVRTKEAKYLVTYDLRTLETLNIELYDLVADPREATSLPPGSASRFGPEFVAAIERLRASVAGLHDPR